MQPNESDFVSKGACPDCGSSDACALYSDGHTFCFACSNHKQGDGSASQRQPEKRAAGLLENISHRAIESRRISMETCKKLNYGVTVYQGKPAQVAHYYDAEGQLVAQKIRLPNKDFRVVGDMKQALPFGAHAFQKTGKRVVVTEGEIDALSMSQVQGNRWPVVSIGCGADRPTSDDGREMPMNKIRRYIATHRHYFLGFEEVVLMFDSDEQGVASAKVAAEVIGPTARIATLPLKDPNEMLLAGRVEEMVDAIWRAKRHQPDGIVALEDAVDSVLGDVVHGKSWSLDTLTKLTYGRRNGEVWAIGAGAGIGKTDFLLQEAAHAVMAHGDAVGLFFLEASVADVALRLAGKIAGRAFHVPDDGWTMDERDSAVRQLAATGKVFLYDNFGMTEWDRVAGHIRYLHEVHGVSYFVVDNLTSFLTGADDERREADRIVAASAMLAQELGVFIWLVSHLATPEGKPHEEGGRVMLRHFKGSRGIAAWLFFAIGLERDQQAEDEDARVTTTVRILKDRFTGRSTGKTFSTKFNQQSCLLEETDYLPPPPRRTEDNPFVDTTAPADAGDSFF